MNPLRLLRNRCPACEKGAIFRGIYAMNRECPSCGIKFEKEPGYFMGAVVAGYFIGAFSIIPLLIGALLILHLSLGVVVALGTAQLLILHPFLFHYSRLVWMNVEATMTRRLERRDLPRR